jgi:hypothetical protein
VTGLVGWLLLRPLLEPLGRLVVRCLVVVASLIAAQVLLVQVWGVGLPGPWTLVVACIVGGVLVRRRTWVRGFHPAMRDAARSSDNAGSDPRTSQRQGVTLAAGICVTLSPGGLVSHVALQLTCGRTDQTTGSARQKGG